MRRAVRLFRILGAAGLVLLASASPRALHAAPPTREHPVAFDSAERVSAVVPALAARLALAPPEWPVASAFHEARLYESAAGDFVLVVEYDDGSLDRWPLSVEERTALRAAVDRGAAAAGNVLATRRLDEFAEPAGGRFVRGQLPLAALAYGPSAAMLATDGDASAAVALYLGTTGAAIFTAAKLSKSMTISRPQAHLATDGGWKGAAIGAGLAYAAGLDGNDDTDERNIGAMILGGGLVGTGLGLRLGRSLTDAEAHGASFGSTIGAALTAGAIGIGGGFDDEGGGANRGEVAGVVAGAVAGYPLGLQYARRASYAITAGDIGALTVASGLGVLAATPFVVGRVDDPSGPVIAGVLTAGLVAGTLAGDRLLVRPVDHTENEGWMVGIGAVAGGLVASAFPALDDSRDDRLVAAVASIGSIVGMVLTERMISPKRETSAR